MAKALNSFCACLFQTFGLNKVYAQTGAFNQASVRLLERTGFRRDGVLRQHHPWNGVLWDDYLYSLLAEDVFSTERRDGDPPIKPTNHR